jgi:sortase A
MIRRLATVAGVALLVAACSSAGSKQTDDAPVLATTAPPSTAATARAPSTIATTTIPLAPVSTTAAPVAPTAPATTLPKPIAPPAESATEPLAPLGSIAIPKLGLSATMYEGVTLSTFDHGPGHWPGTAMPGQVGNVVVGGHRVSHTKPFRYLDKLAPGDAVVFTLKGASYTYTVASTEIVTPDAIRIIDQTPAKTATLFACNPPGSTTQRIVIHLNFQA